MIRYLPCSWCSPAFKLHENLVLQTDRQFQGRLNDQPSAKSVFQYVCKTTSISKLIIKNHKEGRDNTVETLTYWSKETLIRAPKGKLLEFSMRTSKSSYSFLLLHCHKDSIFGVSLLFLSFFFENTWCYLCWLLHSVSFFVPPFLTFLLLHLFW